MVCEIHERLLTIRSRDHDRYLTSVRRECTAFTIFAKLQMPLECYAMSLQHAQFNEITHLWNGFIETYAVHYC